MTDLNTKMLQTLIDGQASIRSLINDKVGSLKKDIERLDIKIDNVEDRLTARIDKLGLQIAQLEDDAPTREELEVIDTRLKKVEKKVATVS